MRILAIDFGEKRVGLAVSDPAGRLALPYGTLRRRSDRDLLRQLAEVIRAEEIGELIVGEPRNVDGSAGEAVRRIRSFTRKLEAASGLSCRLVTETLTSVEAIRRLRDAGVDPRSHPERIDTTAAQILLEESLPLAGRS